jgi:hypothetical protein
LKTTRLQHCVWLRHRLALFGRFSAYSGHNAEKTLHASEQEREDVKAAQAEWKESQPALDVTKLVCLDATGASTAMTRARGRAPKGERCLASVPRGHWKTTT